MLQRRSQHFSKRNRHVYAAERMQHTSVYNSSGVSFSRGRTAVSGYGACDVRAIGWSRVPVWVPSEPGALGPSLQRDAYAVEMCASTCLFVDCGMECHRLEKGRSTRPERAREDGLDSSVPGRAWGRRGPTETRNRRRHESSPHKFTNVRLCMQARADAQLCSTAWRY